MMPLESRPPTLHNKIVLKNITETTRDSNPMTPVSNKTPSDLKPKEMSVNSNPYEVGGEVNYGYAGLFR